LSESLAVLEQQRSSTLVQILGLGDFRSGSITAIGNPDASVNIADVFARHNEVWRRVHRNRRVL
jgi:hypothetical protein